MDRDLVLPETRRVLGPESLAAARAEAVQVVAVAVAIVEAIDRKAGTS